MFHLYIFNANCLCNHALSVCITQISYSFSYILYIFVSRYISILVSSFYFHFHFFFFLLFFFSIIQRVHCVYVQINTHPWPGICCASRTNYKLYRCTLVALAVLRLVTTEIVRFPKDCNFMFHICILYSFVSRHVELACVPIFLFFFSLSLYLHVMSLHDPFLFDLIFVNIYTRRDLKLIEIQIKPIVTFLRNYLLLAIMKIYSTKPQNLQNIAQSNL